MSGKKKGGGAAKQAGSRIFVRLLARGACEEGRKWRVGLWGILYALFGFFGAFGLLFLLFWRGLMGPARGKLKLKLKLGVDLMRWLSGDC